jgi:hypothetical protein
MLELVPSHQILRILRSSLPRMLRFGNAVMLRDINDLADSFQCIPADHRPPVDVKCQR